MSEHSTCSVRLPISLLISCTKMPFAILCHMEKTFASKKVSCPDMSGSSEGWTTRQRCCIAWLSESSGEWWVWDCVIFLWCLSCHRLEGCFLLCSLEMSSLDRCLLRPNLEHWGDNWLLQVYWCQQSYVGALAWLLYHLACRGFAFPIPQPLLPSLVWAPPSELWNGHFCLPIPAGCGAGC